MQFPGCKYRSISASTLDTLPNTAVWNQHRWRAWSFPPAAAAACMTMAATTVNSIHVHTRNRFLHRNQVACTQERWRVSHPADCVAAILILPEPAVGPCQENGEEEHGRLLAARAHLLLRTAAISCLLSPLLRASKVTSASYNLWHCMPEAERLLPGTTTCTGLERARS